MRGQLSKEQRQQQVITRLKNENIRLREELKDAFKKIILLEEENQKLKQKLEKAFLLIEELQQIVFGRARMKREDDKDNNRFSETGKRKKTDRDSSSYRRETPKEEEITREECHSEEICQHCSHKLTKLKKLEFYTEDILRITRNITGLTI